MNDEFLDFLAGFSNYTGKALEANFQDDGTKEELIKEIIDNTDITLPREVLEKMDLIKIKYLKVLSDSFNEILRESSLINWKKL